MRRTTPVFLVAVVAVAGAVGLGVGSIGGAGASVTGVTQVGDSHVSAASASGELVAVDVELGGTLEYSGFENDVEEISFILGTTADGFSGADSEVVSPPEPGTSGTVNISNIGGGPGISIQTENLDPPAEGETITHTVPVDVTVSVSNFEGESAEYTTTHNVTVEITNLAETGENGTSDGGADDGGGNADASDPSLETDIEWDVDVMMAEDY